MAKSLGGYFELELKQGYEYHPSAFGLNTGVNAFRTILEHKNFNKVYLPYYSCDSLITPLEELNIPFEFFPIDSQLEPIFDFTKARSNEALMVINYFGLKDKMVNELATQAPHLIVDNAQSFFSKPFSGAATFYSPRKFFGVPDGAYLYLDGYSDAHLPMDESDNRLSHLITRIERSPEEGYPDFLRNEENLGKLPIKIMSKLTRRLLRNIDYENVAKLRVQNFERLESALSTVNLLKVSWDEKQIPMVYPFLTTQKDIRKELIKRRIYVACYWPHIIKTVSNFCFEHTLATNLLPLPIDQRYNKDDMKNY